MGIWQMAQSNVAAGSSALGEGRNGDALSCGFSYGDDLDLGELERRTADGSELQRLCCGSIMCALACVRRLVYWARGGSA